MLGRRYRFLGAALCALLAAGTVEGPAATAQPSPPRTAAVYEAEQATLVHAVAETTNPGYSGTGYVNYDDQAGGYIEWNVTAKRTGTQKLSFRYAVPNDVTRPVDIAVNGAPARTESFTPTGGPSSWHTLSVNVRLRRGANTVRATATATAGGPYVDWLAVGDWTKHVPDMSTAVVESTMKRFTPDTLGPWSYPEGLYLYGQYLVYKRTHDPRYLTYIKAWADRFVDANGHIANSFSSLDAMESGNVLLVLYAETGDVRYKNAAAQIRARLDTYPRTSDGGFWHATSRQHQLWGDGTFMVNPFLVRYGKAFDDSTYAGAEVVKQLLIYAGHLQDQTGLLLHAYDESGAQSWADPVTHRSPEHWCRAVGWYGMAATQILDEIPANQPGRAQLIDVVRRLVQAFAHYQDPKTGRWFQVVDKGDVAGNWTETSCSSMYTYTISKAIQRGYVGHAYLPYALKGYRGVLANVNLGPDGLADIIDICIGTNVGDLAFYFARPRATNDLHGLGAFLLMNEQLVYQSHQV